MSLPRFLRGLQKKTPPTHQHSSAGDQHLSDGSSSSSSSGPKDALGFPIPVTTSISATTLAPRHVESNQSSAGSSPNTSLYPGPMDIATKRTSAGSTPGSALSSAASSLISDSHDLTSMGTPQRRRARDRTSQTSSRSSFSSIRNARDPTGHDSASLHSTSCPQPTMSSSFDLSTAPPLPLSTLMPTIATIPTVNITTPSESRPPRPLYPPPAIPEASAAAARKTTGFDVDPFAIHEDRYAHAATVTATKGDGDPLSSRTSVDDAHVKRRSKEAAQILSQPAHPHSASHPTRGNRVRSNAVAFSGGTNNKRADTNSETDANQEPSAPIRAADGVQRSGRDHETETSSHSSGPSERVTKPRSRSSTGSPEGPGASHASHASKDSIRLQRHERDSGEQLSSWTSASATTSAAAATSATATAISESAPASSASSSSARHRSMSSPHAAPAAPSSTIRPVSILKNRPKSNLRSRSGSHPLPMPLPMQDGSSPPLIQAFPAPPTGLRTSISSDTSTLSRSSLYLQQDPMAGERRRDDLQSLQEANPKSSNSRRSSLQAQRRLSAGEPDVSLSGSSSLHSTSADHSNFHARPRMPPTPSSTHPSALQGADQDEYEPVIKRRPNSDNTEPSTAALHRLSFPSLNDYKPLSSPSSPPYTSATNHPAPTTPPQSYTPLTLKSVRLAKSKSKLRQDPHIGVATGSRRNSLPKSAHSALASGGDSSGTGSPPSSLPPPLPTPFSSADSPGSSGGMLARRNTEGSLLSAFQHPRDLSPARKRESSSNSGSNTPPVMPRPILKDTSARDKVQRESWMSEAVGTATSGNYALGPSRPTSGQSPSPIAPPKSLARNNSFNKRQSRLPRMSIPDYDQDALTPRPRQGSSGYGPDYKPRRQSGGPGHLLYTFDRNASSAEFESEDYDDSDQEDAQIHSQHLQEQYSRLQTSHSRQSTLQAGEEGAPISKKPQRKSLGDELDVPPVPEKSSQRKRVSTMGSTTLPTLSPSLTAALTAATNSTASASETLSSIVRSNNQPLKDRSRPYGSVGANSLSFEPLFALKDNNLRPAQSAGHLQVGNKDASIKRLSAAVSDADGYAALLTVDPSQQGVSILDISKRELTEIPSGLPESITHLRLAYNMIQVLAPISSLTMLNNLQVLDLCDNQLELLPSEIGLLIKLKELYLSNNKLCKLPDSIQKMARLEVLDIRNNQFYLLNPALAKMKALRQLDVRNNHLNAIPAPLCMLSATLTALLVDGNQFVQPFLDLLQPLMMDDTESITSGRQSFLGDDPYGDPHSKKTPLLAARPVSVYEPWRREAAPITRRTGGALGAPAVAKRRSHGDLMTLIGLQRKDGGASTEDLFALTSDPATPRSNTISVSSGAYIASVMGAETMSSRRERSVSTSTVTPATEHYGDSQGSNSPLASHPLSLNKFLKSIRKSSKSSLRDSQFSTRSDATKRFSIGSEVDPMVDLESDNHDPEARPNSKGTISSIGGVNGRRAPAGGINQWVRDRFHKRTNSSDMGALSGGHASVTSISTEAMESSEGYTVRDSGYGVISGSAGSQSSPSLNSTPDMAVTSSQGKSYGLLGNRYQNKSTGHLPFGSTSARDSQNLSSSFDPAQRKERNYRYSCMSIESQMTQGTEHDSDLVELDSAIAHHIQQQHQHHQHRMSSMHSPTTPLPSSPVISGGISNGSNPNHWNAGSPRYGQSVNAIKPLMQYLRDLYDLDPDSSEWEEVYAWRRVWNAERSTPVGLGVSSDDVDVEDDEEDKEKKQAKDEEIRLAKLQAQAARRRRIVDEIVSTERTYVEGLKGLVEIYLTPALQVMPSSDHKAVFSNAHSIYSFHANHFLPALEKAFRVAPEPATAATLAVEQEQNTESAQSVTTPMSPVPSTGPFASATTTTSSMSASSGQVSSVSSSSKDETSVETADSETSRNSSTTVRPPAAAKPAVEDRIGRVFAEHVDYMKMYSFYINNFDNALRVLQTQLTQAKHKKKMKEFLRRCAKHPNHTQLALQGYLLLPVQRIPRYKLLLQDLLENTWPEHVDYQEIATALEKITSRADEMNERKRQYENHEKVLLVQNRIIGQYKTPLVQPHRKVVREGMLHLIRIVTRNVSMGLDKVVPINGSYQDQALQQQQQQQQHQQNNGDLTVHYLSEETVEKSFLFILFNDIMIQCNPVTGKAVGGGMTGSNNNSGGGGAGNGVNGHAGTDTVTSGSAAGGASDARTKNLELCRVLQLESRLHPAEVVGQDVLRVVDDAMVLYLTGDKDVIHAWKEDINSRW